MKKNTRTCMMGILAVGISLGATAQKTVMVGGAAIYPTKNIVENAIN